MKNAASFCYLYDKTKCPTVIGGESYSWPSMPSFPPQLALVISNVDLKISMEDFKEELVYQFPQIHQVIRLKNKYQTDIKLVKLEILSHTVRDGLLADGKIRVSGMTYDVNDYLAPATVLICSKCMGIGHFRRQCQQVNETCKTCGDSFQDPRLYQCSTVNRCIHCDGDHVSNSQRCPVVKEFRSVLTKQLLGRNPAPQA